MHGELARKVKGEASYSRAERELIRRATEILERGLLSDYEAQVIVGLAKKLMDGARVLDVHRRVTAGADVELNTICGRYELTALQQLDGVQQDFRSTKPKAASPSVRSEGEWDFG